MGQRQRRGEAAAASAPAASVTEPTVAGEPSMSSTPPVAPSLAPPASLSTTTPPAQVHAAAATGADALPVVDDDATWIDDGANPENERPRAVLRHGLTLRELYGLKRSADAWSLVARHNLQEAEAAEAARRAQARAEQRGLAATYERQVAEAHGARAAARAETMAFAAQQRALVEAEAAAAREALLAKQAAGAQYRATFMSDMEKLRQRQKVCVV